VYEYKRIRLHIWEEHMSELAADGWRLHTIYADWVYLERPVQPQ